MAMLFKLSIPRVIYEATLLMNAAALQPWLQFNFDEVATQHALHRLLYVVMSFVGGAALQPSLQRNFQEVQTQHALLRGLDTKREG